MEPSVYYESYRKMPPVRLKNKMTIKFNNTMMLLEHAAYVTGRTDSTDPGCEYVGELGEEVNLLLKIL